MIEILDRFGHLDGRGWNLKRWYESHISPIRFCMTGNQLHLQMHINCVGNHKMQVCQSLYKFLKTSLFSMELKLYLVFFFFEYRVGRKPRLRTTFHPRMGWIRLSSSAKRRVNTSNKQNWEKYTIHTVFILFLKLANGSAWCIGLSLLIWLLL